MEGNAKSWLALLMGVVILVADLYWVYTSAFDALWVALGVIILIADLVWIYLDYSLMKG
jgi:hypothetical protein